MSTLTREIERFEVLINDKSIPSALRRQLQMQVNNIEPNNVYEQIIDHPVQPHVPPPKKVKGNIHYE